MSKKTRNLINNKEDIKMAKYIVEAPEPKRGQKVSTGGIRENGKIASQFKNPVPYKEPMQSPTVITHNSNLDLIRKEQAKSIRNEVGMYLLGLAWQEFGEPILRSGLHKLGNVIINKIEGPACQTPQKKSSPKPKIIDVETDEIETINDDKIIVFPSRKAI